MIICIMAIENKHCVNSFAHSNIAYMHTFNLRKILAERLIGLMEASLDMQTQNAVGKRAGLNQTTVRNILNQTVATSIDNIESIARAFGVEASELLAEKPSNTTLAEWERKIEKLPPEEQERIVQFIRFAIDQSYAALNKQTLNSIITSEPLPSAIQSSALMAANRSVNQNRGNSLNYEKKTDANNKNKPTQRKV